jgi:hypothetical protein
LRVREDAGETGAAALAEFLFHVVAQAQGDEAVWRLAAAAFGADVPEDLRGWWRDWWSPPESRLRSATGLDFAKLAALAQAKLQPPAP